MDEQLDISVVVPCYNTEEYIEECLTSALSQEDVRLEVIVVDDCSTDGSLKIIQRLASQHPNLRVIRNEENQGQARSRNTAMAAARGDYIALLDSDDYYAHPRALADWVATARESGCQMCVANFSILGTDGSLRRKTPVETTLIAAPLIDQPSLVNAMASWQIIYEREFLEKNRLHFSRRMRQREDRLFFVLCFIIADRIFVTDDFPIVYRIRPGSTMRTKTLDQLKMYTYNLRLMLRYMNCGRKAGRFSIEFERANNIIPWSQAFFYWNGIIEKELLRSIGGVSTSTSQKAVFAFLEALHKLSALAEQPSNDDIRELAGEGAYTARAEGLFDVAAICLELKRYDLFLKLLKRERLHFLELMDLSQASKIRWSEDAITHYLRFQRDYRFSGFRQTQSSSSPLEGIDRLVLHIGQPKTGSSAIQRALEDSRIRLAEEGVLYPLSGAVRERGVRRHRSSGHLHLFQKILSGDQSCLDQLASEIKYQRRAINTVILSCENLLSDRLLNSGFSSCTAAVARSIEALGARNVETIGIFREPKEWAKSYYRELSGAPFNGFFESPYSFIEKITSQGLLDYRNLQEQISALPQITRTHFAHYADVRKVGAESWFFQAIGLEHTMRARPGINEVNSSLSDAQALKIMMSKPLLLSRARREEIYLETVSDTKLAESSFDLFDGDRPAFDATETRIDADTKKRDEAWFHALLERAALESSSSLFSFSDLKLNSILAQRAGDMGSADSISRPTWEALGPYGILGWRHVLPAFVAPVIASIGDPKDADRYLNDPIGFFRSLSDRRFRTIGRVLYPWDK